MIPPPVVLERLKSVGIVADAVALRLESRQGRTLAFLDHERIAWFPENAEGRTSIEKERRVLRLIEQHCRYRAPRIVYEHEEGWDIRATVSGVAGPDFLHLVRTDSDASKRLGTSIGSILAEQHARIPPDQLSDWLTRVSPWPEPGDIERVADVVTDKVLLRRIGRALELCDEVARDLSDPVLVHGDLGPWNLACDPASGALNGVFDYGDACFADRCQDFKYMQFQKPDEQSMLEAAIVAYEREVGIRLDRHRIRFFNAIDAIGFLGHRFGKAPEEAWCGRTLDEDLAWTEAALSLVGL